MSDSTPIPPAAGCVILDAVQTPGTARGDRTSDRPSLRRNFSWNLAGNFVYAGCQWGILIVIANLTSPEMVGRFALGMAVTAPIIMLSNMQLRGVQATDARGEFLLGHYLGLRLITTALALLIIAAIVYSGAYSRQANPVIFIIGIAKAIESISDVYYGFMQRHERMDHIAKSMVTKGVISLSGLGVMVYATRDVFWGVLGLMLAWVLILVFYDLPSSMHIVRRYSENRDLHYKALLPKFDRRSILQLAWLALPLGIVMGLISLSPNIPRYVVEHYWGETYLGIFAALSYLIVAGSAVVSALGQSATPRLANYFASGEFSKFRALLTRLALMGAAIGASGIVVVLLAGRALLAWLYGPEYADHVDVLTCLMIAGSMAFVASILGCGMTAARYFIAQMPLFLVVTGATMLSAWRLVPEKGLLGAAGSLAIGSLLQVVGSAIILLHACRRRNDSSEK